MITFHGALESIYRTAKLARLKLTYRNVSKFNKLIPPCFQNPFFPSYTRVSITFGVLQYLSHRKYFMTQPSFFLSRRWQYLGCVTGRASSSSPLLGSCRIHSFWWIMITATLNCKEYDYWTLPARGRGTLESLLYHTIPTHVAEGEYGESLNIHRDSSSFSWWAGRNSLCFC